MARFTIDEIVRARRPILLMVGHVAEGAIQIGDRLTLRVAGGSSERIVVVGVERSYAKRNEPPGPVCPESGVVGLAFCRRGEGRWRAEDLVCGEVETLA